MKLVLFARPHCPECGSVSLETTRTIERSADLIAQRKRCRGCGETFVLYLEWWPDFGSHPTKIATLPPMIANAALHSLGYLAVRLRVDVPTIRRAADELQLLPTVVINGVPHYGQNDLAILRAHLAAGSSPPALDPLDLLDQ